MGKSAKLTRGGNKKRVNVGRQEAKLKAQGAKVHTGTKHATKAASDDAKRTSKLAKKHEMSQKLKVVKNNAIVKMAPKPAKAEDAK